MRAVVTGMIATFPVGGVAWDYGQYALGLERMGFDVYYLEDTGLPSYTYDPARGDFVEDCSYGVRFLEESLTGLSPSLKGKWHYRDFDGGSHGIDAEAFDEIVAGADILINVSGGSLLREPYRRCPRKVLIDTDPGWNHFVIFPRWDARSPEQRLEGFRSHDSFFTYALKLGQPDCPLATFGLQWHATLPPVVMDCWESESPGERWTTVMMWNNYKKPIEHNGRTYGAKEMEFGRVEALPAHVPASFEVAVNGEAPAQRWQALGWSVVNAHPKSVSLDAYRAYIQRSRGEFSVAKNVYVATHSGWVSCRSVCYLAAGRPVVVQETGFSGVIPTGRGLLSFSSLEEAASAVASIERDYEGHQRAARALAAEHFDAGRVLGDLLERAGLG